MNKKAAIGMTLLQEIPRILLTVFVTLSIVFLISSFSKTEVKTFSAETNLMIQRIVFSEAISYYDNDINSLYPGIIDVEKFSAADFDAKISKNIFYGERNSWVGAKLHLQPMDYGFMNIERYYNEDYYKRKEVLLGFEGIGGVDRNTQHLFVLAIDQFGTHPSKLTIDVIMSRS